MYPADGERALKLWPVQLRNGFLTSQSEVSELIKPRTRTANVLDRAPREPGESKPSRHSSAGTPAEGRMRLKSPVPSTIPELNRKKAPENRAREGGDTLAT